MLLQMAKENILFAKYPHFLALEAHYATLHNVNVNNGSAHGKPVLVHFYKDEFTVTTVVF